MTDAGLPPPAPALDDPRYLVEDPHMIVHLLGELSKHAIPVIIHMSDSDLTSPSLVLDVTEHGLLMDGSSVDAINAKLARSGRLYCQAELEKVPLRFVIDAPQRLDNNGRTHFSSPLPARFFYHQRRELYRLETPLMTSPVCRIPDEENPQAWHELRVADIGMGGLGLQHQLAQHLLPIGHVLEGCELLLPEGKPLPISIRIANDRVSTRPDGEAVRRTGVSFLKLSNAAQTAISRYIFSIERQRKARR